MSGSGSLPSPAPAGPRYEALFAILLPVLALLAAIVPINHEPQPPYLTGNYSPFGYTLSLGLFLIPCISLSAWLMKERPRLPYQWRAFWITAGIVVPLWCTLDILLGNTFFFFPNPGATLGVFVPGYTFGEGWMPTIPVEEFAFYILGCFSILLGYIWASESWLSAYTQPKPAYLARVRQIPRLVDVHVSWVLGGIAIFLAVLAWKKLGPHPFNDGFPGYFLFELLLVITPTAVLYRAVGPLLNVPAFVYKTLTLLLVSLLWEVTLGLPYGWWAYHSDQMMGIVIRPWYDLPIEAAMLWPCAAWMNITLYESVRVYLHSGRPLYDVLFVARTPPAVVT